MRLAYVGPFGFHPKKTMRSRAFKLAQPLVQRGHEVKMFMPPWHTPDEANKEWNEDGVAIRYTPIQNEPFGTFWKLLQEVQHWQPDIVHSFKPKAYSGLVAWWLWTFQRSKQRLITDTDDWEGWGGWNDVSPYPRWQKHFFAWQEKWGLSHCHGLTVASKTLRLMALDNGASPEKTVYLPNGPGIEGQLSTGLEEREELGLLKRPVILLYTRFFEFDAARLAAILRQVYSVLPELAVLVVGMSLHEVDAESFRKSLQTEGLLDTIVDVGWVEEERLPGLLASADAGLYLMDDTLLNWTKCPVKLADMLYAGVPTVGEAIGQVSEFIISGKTGFLRPPGDIAGLTEDLLCLLQDPILRKKLSKGARRHIQNNFSWNKLADLAEQLYLDNPSKEAH